MHEEDFWSSWLKEDERGKAERTRKKLRDKKKTRVKRGEREEEKEENETETVNRRCECFVSVETLEIFSQGRDSDVMFPLCAAIGNFVEPQSSSFSRKRALYKYAR